MEKSTKINDFKATGRLGVIAGLGIMLFTLIRVSVINTIITDEYHRAFNPQLVYDYIRMKEDLMIICIVGFALFGCGLVFFIAGYNLQNEK